MRSFPIQTVQDFTTACGTFSGSGTGDALASDASGYHMFVVNGGSATVYAPDGTMVASNHTNPNAESELDTNGNYYSVFKDTIGRTFAYVGNFTTGVDTYTVPNSSGGTSTYTIREGLINVSTNFQVPGITEFSGTIRVINEIDLPDGTKYLFTYDCDSSANSAFCSSPTGQGAYYGSLTSMTLPAGGQISYTWSIFKDAYGNPYPWLTARSTSDGNWTYTPNVQTPCGSGQVNCTQTVTVKKPSADNEVYTFALNGGAWNGMVQYYNGAVSSSNLIATVNQCFNFVTITNGQCSYAPTSGSPATNVTKSAVTVTWPGTNINSTTEYTYDGFGNVTQKAEWNFYTGTLPTSADRTTNLTYLTDKSLFETSSVRAARSQTLKHFGLRQREYSK